MIFLTKTTAVFTVFLSLAFLGSQLAGAPVGRFVNVRPASEFASGSLDGAIEISPDGLSAYFSSTRSGSFDIFKATRAALDQPFGEIMRLGPEFNSNGTEYPGAISNDGLALYYTSTGLAGQGLEDMFVATRSTVNEPFGNVRNLGSGLNTRFDDSPEAISADGKTLYFNSSRPGGSRPTSIWKATRTSSQDDFANPTVLFTDDVMQVHGGSISADGLYFFFAKSRFPTHSELWVASRNSLEDEFANPVSLAAFSPDSETIFVSGTKVAWQPAIAPGWPALGSKIYFNYGLGPSATWTIYEATWVPEPGTGLMLLTAMLTILLRRRTHSVDK